MNATHTHHCETFDGATKPHHDPDCTATTRDDLPADVVTKAGVRIAIVTPPADSPSTSHLVTLMDPDRTHGGLTWICLGVAEGWDEAQARKVASACYRSADLDLSDYAADHLTGMARYAQGQSEG